VSFVLENALSEILRAGSDYQLEQLLAAVLAEERATQLVDATRGKRHALARFLRERAEIELGAREAIRAGAEACPQRDEPVEVARG